MSITLYIYEAHTHTYDAYKNHSAEVERFPAAVAARPSQFHFIARFRLNQMNIVNKNCPFVTPSLSISFI